MKAAVGETENAQTLASFYPTTLPPLHPCTLAPLHQWWLEMAGKSGNYVYLYIIIDRKSVV